MPAPWLTRGGMHPLLHPTPPPASVRTLRRSVRNAPPFRRFCKFWPITTVAEGFDLPYTGVINRPELQVPSTPA